MKWTKDTYATCCVNMLKITRFYDQHFCFFKFLRILYLWNPIQFEIFFMFNKWTENSILACSTLLRTGSIKFCKVELHGFVLVALLMTSWQIRYHNIVLASFSLWLMQTLFSHHAYGLFRYTSCIYFKIKLKNQKYIYKTSIWYKIYC